MLINAAWPKYPSSFSYNPVRSGIKMDGGILKSVFLGGVLPIFFLKSQKGDGTEQQCLFLFWIKKVIILFIAKIFMKPMPLLLVETRIRFTPLLNSLKKSGNATK
jgi:hypothetical protein